MGEVVSQTYNETNVKVSYLQSILHCMQEIVCSIIIRSMRLLLQAFTRLRHHKPLGLWELQHVHEYRTTIIPFPNLFVTLRLGKINKIAVLLQKVVHHHHSLFFALLKSLDTNTGANQSNIASQKHPTDLLGFNLFIIHKDSRTTISIHNHHRL
jgi:hypothetical protein